MENSIQSLLKEFYSISIQNHPQRQQKMQTLESCFSKLDNSFKSTFENTKLNADGQYETQASIRDFEPFSFNPCQSHICSSNILGTFLHSSQVKNKNKVVSKNIFTDPSIIRVLIYAFFINYIHINKKTDSIQNSKYLGHSLRFAQQTIKKLKVAMVSAAQTFKNTDRKKYAKIRYLYDQLTNYLQKDSILKQDYIKVIIEELDPDFLQQIFKCLSSKWDQLLYSQSFDSILISGDLLSNKSEPLEAIDRALQYLQVKMILLKDQVQVDDQEFSKDMNIVVQEMPNGAFKLNQIVSIHGLQGF